MTIATKGGRHVTPPLTPKQSVQGPKPGHLASDLDLPPDPLAFRYGVSMFRIREPRGRRPGPAAAPGPQGESP